MSDFVEFVNYDSFVDVHDFERMLEAFKSKFNTDSQIIATTAFRTLVPEKFKVNVAEIATTLDYVGFNPIVTLQTFQARAKAAVKEGDYIITAEDGKTELLKIPKRGEVQTDMAVLVTVFATRGASAGKILKKVSPQWVDVLQDKFAIYGISTKKVPGQLKPDDITLARLAGCVPHMVVALMHLGIGRVYIRYKTLCDAFNIQYPKAALSQMFSGIVPRSGVGSELITHCFAYSFMFDRIINPKRKVTDFKAYLDELVKFVEASNSSSLYEDNFRRDNLVYCGILENKRTTNFVYTALGRELVNAGNLMWNVISNAYTADESHRALSETLVLRARTNIEASKEASSQSSSKGILALKTEKTMFEGWTKLATGLITDKEMSDIVNLLATTSTHFDTVKIIEKQMNEIKAQTPKVYEKLKYQFDWYISKCKEQAKIVPPEVTGSPVPISQGSPPKSVRGSPSEDDE